jgi:hypothetical protein
MEDIFCAVFAFNWVERRGGTELGQVGVWLVSKPWLALPLIVVLLLHSLASDSAGIGWGAR